MAQLEPELEKQLSDAGNKLLSPPSSVPQLLALLDRLEKILTRVGQSPTESMNKALSPSLKALIADDLLKHSNVDVRVAVASCISEITRITAPDAPYDDARMKEVFQLIVSSFEKLDDKLSPSYIKRIAILDTVAKVRSCVVMLDLECDALIIEMFQHFFRYLRDDHPGNVFSSMETIITLILEESEDVSSDLVSLILDSLKIDNKEALPIARQLGEKVFEKCASKLKPYLLPVIKSQGGLLKDYCKIVANVCEIAPEDVEPSEGDTASKNVADESDLGNVHTEKAAEVAVETLDDAPPSEEVGAPAAGSPKSVVSNGTVQKEIEDTSAGIGDTKLADCDNHDQVKVIAEPIKVNVDSIDDGEHAKSQSKSEKPIRRKGRKTSSLKSSSKPSESAHADDKKETDKVPAEQKKGPVDADATHCKDAMVENKGDPDGRASSPRTLENDNKSYCVHPPSPNGTVADDSHPRKVEQERVMNDDLVQESVSAASDTNSKKESDPKRTPEGAHGLESGRTETHKVTGGSESGSHEDAGKKASSEINNEEHLCTPIAASNKDGNKSSLDVKTAKQSGKKVEVVSSHKRGQGKGASKDLVKTSLKKEKKPLAKSTEKSTKDGSDVEKSSKTSSKRKRSPNKGKASGTKDYREELIGSKIEVLWPSDKAYYKGVVVSFDSVKRKHKVVYEDGDMELLKLAKEKWNFIEDHSMPDEEPTHDADEVSEMQKGKKAKTSEEQQMKGGKAEIAANKKGGASASKSTVTPKSSRKLNDDIKVADKPKEESSNTGAKPDQDKGGKYKGSKAGNKSSGDTPKSVGKSKDDNLNTSKGATKSKQDTPKGASKSKGKTSKANSKIEAKDIGEVKTDLSSKGKEDEAEDVEKSPEITKGLDAVKGKSPEITKGLDAVKGKSPSGSKGAKKRKRGGRS